MESGIYHFRFQGGPSGNYGDGIAVLKDGTINGGDVGYVYRGSYKTEGNRLIAKINLKQWKMVPNALFNLPEFAINIDAPLPGDLKNFTLEGRLEGAGSVHLVGRRLENVA